MLLPKATTKYDLLDIARTRATLEAEDKRNVKIGFPIYITAPNGGRWKLVVDNVGTLTTEVFTP